MQYPEDACGFFKALFHLGNAQMIPVECGWDPWNKRQKPWKLQVKALEHAGRSPESYRLKPGGGLMVTLCQPYGVLCDDDVRTATTSTFATYGVGHGWFASSDPTRHGVRLFLNEDLLSIGCIL